MKTRVFHYTESRAGLSFHCPGCDLPHTVTTTGPGAWSWNGDREQPVLSPSVLVQGGPHLCHSFVGCNGAQPGEIVFLSDCTHALAGQVRPLPEWASATS